ncbi:Holliday junction resolvase RuvX [Trueperella pecoris]|uniref:Putative pre-16S rRNA nuclease n=1 Tax=Trueperella pecoris TaxID=2733571 RepID=A0A7M1QXG7_9ACTO|nr:Holliday junction resolvase RuvX [Trueperella pecoris]QOR46511.1 Holliday junction resolvase RuvX [Trueperella pecoris]QTG76337.1 Holliday junction resolvase RuvX [Trueperella pecoris]
MRIGVRFGIDVGAARVGVARCDAFGILATPVATLKSGRGDLDSVAKLVRESQALEVIVGLPLNMDGTEGKSAKMARRWAVRLSRKIAPVPVRMIDERLTTVQAHRQLHEAGRKEITHRSVVDQAAAVIILENALEQERVSGRAPGKLAVAVEEERV